MFPTVYILLCATAILMTRNFSSMHRLMQRFSLNFCVYLHFPTVYMLPCATAILVTRNYWIFCQATFIFMFRVWQRMLRWQMNTSKHGQTWFSEQWARVTAIKLEKHITTPDQGNWYNKRCTTFGPHLVELCPLFFVLPISPVLCQRTTLCYCTISPESKITLCTLLH